MSLYINRGNEGFQRIRKSEYIDKSGLIAVINSTLFTRNCFSCITRSRRFGKSMAAEMLLAYYDHSCDSRSLFADLEIASHPSFEEHLNKYPVIYLDMTRFTSGNDGDNVVSEVEKRVRDDVASVYPDIPQKSDDDLMDFLLRVAGKTGERFIFIIDEWDAPCRIYSDKPQTMDRYVDWLRRMFKDVTAIQAFAGVYLTGILPIKKYKTQSALNNFKEYSMVTPGALARYFGFTKEETKGLAERHGMDFDALEMWYDGYQIGVEMSMFNPNSVMEAISNEWCENYWSKTGAFDAVSEYIDMNYEGLKDDIIDLLSGGRCLVDPAGFSNDISEIRSRDDVLTVLIHLGYLTYDRRVQECFIPNLEVAKEMENAIKANNWKEVVTALKYSRDLLKATLRGDSEYVARSLRAIHSDETSVFSYNDENSLACVISLAYYYARNDYHVHREYLTGEGYADLVLIPRKNVSSPALVIELKYDKSTQTAISQIKTRNYPQAVADYTGDILLVGINYDKDTKQHECQIERWQKS